MILQTERLIMRPCVIAGTAPRLPQTMRRRSGAGTARRSNGGLLDYIGSMVYNRYQEVLSWKPGIF